MNDLTKPRATVPYWVIDVFKLSIPVILGMIALLASYTLLKRDVEDGKAKSVKIEASAEVHRSLIDALSTRVNVLETAQGYKDRSLTESLNRIENEIKDVKREVKELQLQKPNK